MKKMLVLTGWAALFMAGCLGMLFFGEKIILPKAAQKQAAVNKVQEAQLPRENGKEVQEAQLPRENGKEVQESRLITEGAKEASESGYCYGSLTSREKALYVKILQALQAADTDVAVAKDTEEPVFNKVFQCVLNDHPELFYVDGFTLIRYQEDGVVTGKSFSGSYIYNQEEIREREAQIEKKVQEILKEIPANSSEYEKVRFVYEYLIKNTEYVLASEDNQNICSVFLNGSSVCQGYAKAAQYLLKRLGVRAILVSGTVEGGQEHAWNIVQIDGNYYHMDVTWGDASYVADANSGSESGDNPQINYEYLCVPDEQLLQTHSVKNVVPIPACSSMEANYYVMEGAYFSESDLEMAAALFEAAYKRQESYVTLKCADGAVFEKMKEALIGKQAVFGYLHVSEETVAYTVNEEQLVLSFWLQD